MDNGISEAITLLAASNNLHYQIWMFYVVVAIGLLGYRFSETYDSLSFKRRLIIIVGFLGFAISNASTMYQNMIQFNVVLITLKSFDFSVIHFDFSTVFEQFHEKKVINILSFQLVITVLLAYVLYKPKDNL